MPASGVHYPFVLPEVAAAGSDRLYGNFAIRPHRSLSDRQMRGVLLVVAVTGGLFDLTMFLQFGWIVGAITMIDVAFVGLALTLSQRQRHAREIILVRSTGVEIEQRSTGGRLLSRQSLPLYPLSLRCSGEATGDGRIELVSGGRQVRIGSMLLAHERQAFCEALLDSLEQAGAMPGGRQSSSFSAHEARSPSRDSR